MYVILGLGMQGEAILRYLLEQTDDEIVTFDIRSIPKNIEHLFNDNKQWAKHFEGDLLNTYNLVKYLNRKTVVINCLPTEYIEKFTSLCVGSCCNVIDLGGVTDVVREQFKYNGQAESLGITIIPDVGLAPGIVSSFATHFAKKDDWDTEHLVGIRAYCGGIPMYPEPPLGYCKVFYPGGVIKEYSGVSQEIANGNMVNKPALSGHELVFVQSLGVLEARRTSGGTSISVDHLAVDHPAIMNFSYKTLRYPGHWDYFTKHILTQPEPAKVLESMIEDVSIKDPDLIVLSFRLDLSDGGEDEYTYFWTYDPVRELSAMSQATGYIVAAVATMISEGKIRHGVVGMHELDPMEIRNRVVKMGGHNFSLKTVDFQ